MIVCMKMLLLRDMHSPVKYCSGTPWLELYSTITNIHSEPGMQSYSSNLYKCPVPVQSVISLAGVML